MKPMSTSANAPSAIVQPNQHPQRVLLHNEIHARPPEPMQVPLALTHVVMLCDAAQRTASRNWLVQLLRDHHLPLPDEHTTHLRLTVGGVHLRWELHTEFVSWTFSTPLSDADQTARDLPTAARSVPAQWLAGLPGLCLTGMHLWVLPGSSEAPVRHMLHEDTLVACTVADGHGEVYTDFALHHDGFGRMVLLAAGLTPRRLGRLVQQLLEIETYRMAALLGLPAARAAAAELASAERELAELANAIRHTTPQEEPQLLDRLTKLAGQVESQHAQTHARFSASRAYFELVDRRITDIAESRLGARRTWGVESEERPQRDQFLPHLQPHSGPMGQEGGENWAAAVDLQPTLPKSDGLPSGLQTIGEFMQRRLSPARSTCEWAARRQDALSQRVSRMSNLLRTRVEIEQQQSSRELLSAMNHRQGLQLKLQTTVEGLSVAAITYYIVGLLAYAAKGAQKLGWPYSPESTAALAIPLVALAVWWSLRRLHQRVFDA